MKFAFFTTSAIVLLASTELAKDMTTTVQASLTSWARDMMQNPLNTTSKTYLPKMNSRSTMGIILSQEGTSLLNWNMAPTASSSSFEPDTNMEAMALSVAGLIGMYIIVSFFPVPVIASTFLAAGGYSSILAVVVSYMYYVYWVFGQWHKEFPGHRLTRNAKGCPSNQEMSGVKRVKTMLLNDLKHDKMKITKKANHVFRERAERTNAITAANAELEEKDQDSLSQTEANEPNMDHIYLNFSDFLWAYTFIGPFSYLLWLRGTSVLRFRKFLFKIGLIKPECDYEALAATLLLEQTQVIHYCGRTKSNIASFVFADFPYVDEDCNMQIADLFAVDIDLEKKRFMKATLDGKVLNAREAVTLLWYNTITAQHVKLHAMANWGSNVDDSLEEVNPFFRQNSVITVMYNYFGYTTFIRFIKIWVDQGLLSDGWDNSHQPFLKCIDHGIKENVSAHAQIRDLAKHSRFVKFSTKVRAIFLSEFKKHKHLFPGVNGEALFVGTVLHSLDHTFMDWNLKDALYLDTSDNRFGKMAEVGQVVKVGFVSDVGGLYFHKRFKGSGHPFYDAVYAKAAKIDKELADHMDTCIVK